MLMINRTYVYIFISFVISGDYLFVEMKDILEHIFTSFLCRIRTLTNDPKKSDLNDV